MKCIFEASHSTEAHLILHLIERAGLRGFVDGEYLQGAVGELPAIGLVRVMVNDEDYEEARSIIKDWDSEETP